MKRRTTMKITIEHYGRTVTWEGPEESDLYDVMDAFKGLLRILEYVIDDNDNENDESKL
jgi:hypothetical protein